MALVNFLEDLAIKGWQLWSEGGKLRYRAPQTESTEGVLEKLKQHKPEILQLLRDRPEILQVYPLSYGQQAIWYLWQLAPESLAYNTSQALRIRSPIDASRCKKAFQKIIDSHPPLRSTFSKQGPELIQRVQQQEIDFQQIDASGWSAEELNHKLIAEHQRSFNLEKEPVTRVRLFTCSDMEHILLINIHHIAWDGWSIGLIYQEFFKFYSEEWLPSLDYSYRDYIYYQREMLSCAFGEQLGNYWQQQLAGELPLLNLPTDGQRTSKQTFAGASHIFTVDNVAQLKALATAKGTTLYTVLVTALQILLHRYTEQEDILVVSLATGRTKSEFEPLIGYFVNPFVLRGNLADNPTVVEFVGQMRQTIADALTHQEYPFPLLVERLQLQQDPSRPPILPVL
ncbi:MAG: non-ribosomal peptide synthetase, partial [Moorea sp. SIO2I5]|nr:non-ribosomal peptide synthetase [Moorena sp. SIO2I5]